MTYGHCPPPGVEHLIFGSKPDGSPYDAPLTSGRQSATFGPPGDYHPVTVNFPRVHLSEGVKYFYASGSYPYRFNGDAYWLKTVYDQQGVCASDRTSYYRSWYEDTGWSAWRQTAPGWNDWVYDIPETT